MSDINYQDLHKVYNRSRYSLPAVNQEPVKEEEVIDEPEEVYIERPRTVRVIEQYDDPARDLVKTAAQFAVGAAVGNWLGITGPRPQWSSDPNQLWSDVKNPPPQPIKWNY